MGGLIGRNDGSSTNGYWDIDSTNQTAAVGTGNSSGIQGLNTSQMTGSDAGDNMSGFEFGDTWLLTAGEYPVLWWQD